MEKKKRRMSIGKVVLIVFIILFAALTGAAYYAGYSYFSTHFFPGTTVNGFNCSYMTEEETGELLSERVGAFVLAVETKNNGVESITAQDVGLDYVPDGQIGELILAQDRTRWFQSFSQKETYEMEAPVGYDPEKLSTAVGNLDCMQISNVVMPSDAFIKDNGTNFEIVPEVVGNYLNREKTEQVIADAMMRGITSVNLEEEGCYVVPEVYADDPQIIKNCQQMNDLVDVIITYDFADRKETVDRTLIKDWLVKGEDGNYTLDETLVSAYVHELAVKYNTLGNTRTFRNYQGKNIVIEGGTYGWVLDEEAETDGLIETVKSGETQVREPIYLQEGWSRSTNDIGYSYIEIDLTAQRLIVYVDGTPVVDTPVVTGNSNNQSLGTPEGCFYVQYMKSPAIVSEAGTRRNVNYWVSFSQDLGIHDAPWRSQFGENLYLWEGTQGCVDVPADKMASIYANIGVGAPVVIYRQ